MHSKSSSPGRRWRVLITVPHLEAKLSPSNDLKCLIRYLPRDEFDISVCSLRGDLRTETPEYLNELQVPVFVASFRPRSYTLRGLRGTARDSAVIQNAGPFDLQHSLDFATPPFESLFARIRRAKMIVTLTDILRPPILNAGRRLALQAKLKLANRVICISSAVVDYAMSLGVSPEKLCLIHNGVDLDTFEAGFRAGVVRDPNLILSVGQLIPRKRHEDAIRTLAVVRSANPKARLQILGRGWSEAYDRKLRDLAATLGVSDAVEFLGLRDDVPAVMQGAGVLLHCAENEAFGWVVAEAMAADLPVVAADVDGPRELTRGGETGRLVKVGDIDGYVTAVRRALVRGSEVESEVREAATAVRTSFSARVMTERTMSAYRELLGPLRRGN